MREISRRSFLKGSAVGTLGLAAAAGFALPPVVAKAEENTYTATAQGFAGPVTVTATITDGVITAVEAEGPNETPERGGKACEVLPARIVEAGSVKVDAFAGATMTSNASSGNSAFKLSFSAEYTMSRLLTLSFYFDRQKNTPLLSSSSYPTTTQDFGLSLKFSLTR